MNRFERYRQRDKMSSPEFLAKLLLIFLGIVFYLALSHLNDLLNLVTQVYQMVWPFVMAFVVAWLLNPLVKFCEQKIFRRGKPKTRRRLSILLTYLVVVALFTALLYIILPQVYASLVTLVDKVPTYLSGLRDAVNQLAGRFDLLDTENASFILDNYTELVTKLTGWVQGILPQLLNAGVSIGSGVVNVLMAFIASIYMLADKERLKGGVKRCVCALVPSPYDSRTLAFLRRSNSIFSAFIDGKMLDSLIIGLLCLLGCLLLRIPFAGLISLIVGVTNIIPVFGPFIGAVPCLLILLIVEPWSALWFLIFIIALQQLDGNVIGPRILGDSTGVSALGVLVAITVGGKVGSVTGMLLGVPLYAILSLLLRGYLELRLLRKAQHTDTAQDAAWDAAWDMAADSDALDVDAPRQTPDDAPASGQKQGPTTLEEEEHL